MAHKTLISGTAYSVTGGRELISGTGYDCKAGKTLIGGTAFTVPFSKGIPLSTITPGAILYLNESGSPVPFYIAKHDYESGLNGAGRTLIVRKECYERIEFSQWSTSNLFPTSTVSDFLADTWFGLLDSAIQGAAGQTKIYCYIDEYQTRRELTKNAFILSIGELKGGGGDGTPLDQTVRSLLAVAKLNGSNIHQWTRTPKEYSSTDVYVLDTAGNVTEQYCGNGNGVRPAFTLPATTAVTANPDGTYTLAA